jgi:hypothetical protein
LLLWDEGEILIGRLEMDAFGDLLLQVQHLVQQVLQLQVEAVDSLLGRVGRIPGPLDAQLLQSVQLLQGDE